MKLSRIAESTRDLCFPRLLPFLPSPPSLKIGEFQSRGRARKDILLAKNSIPFAKVSICKNFVTSPPFRRGGGRRESTLSSSSLYTKPSSSLYPLYISWIKLLEFRIHRLTQLRPQPFFSLSRCPLESFVFFRVGVDEGVLKEQLESRSKKGGAASRINTFSIDRNLKHASLLVCPPHPLLCAPTIRHDSLTPRLLFCLLRVFETIENDRGMGGLNRGGCSKLRMQGLV